MPRTKKCGLNRRIGVDVARGGAERPRASAKASRKRQRHQVVAAPSPACAGTRNGQSSVAGRGAGAAGLRQRVDLRQAAARRERVDQRVRPPGRPFPASDADERRVAEHVLEHLVELGDQPRLAVVVVHARTRRRAARWSRAAANASSVKRNDSSRRLPVELTSVSESVSAKTIRSYCSSVPRRNARPSLTWTGDTRVVVGRSGWKSRADLQRAVGRSRPRPRARRPCASASATSVPVPAPMIRTRSNFRSGNHAYTWRWRSLSAASFGRPDLLVRDAVDGQEVRGVAVRGVVEPGTGRAHTPRSGNTATRRPARRGRRPRWR